MYCVRYTGYRYQTRAHILQKAITAKDNEDQGGWFSPPGYIAEPGDKETKL